MKAPYLVTQLPDLESDSSSLWRYMDFTKFVSTLEKSTLYFCRADCLGDPFEGSYPRANTPIREDLKRQLEELAGQDEGVKYLKLTSDSNRFIRKITFLNCWHVSEFESAAMWRLYAKTNEAVAVRSTYRKLRTCLHEAIITRPIQYLDFDKEMIPETNKLFPFFFKRRSFEHEKELRAAVMSGPRSDLPFEGTKLEQGIHVKVDLRALIVRIMVAPSAPDWFLELVQSVAMEYGVSSEVARSSLDEEPFF